MSDELLSADLREQYDGYYTSDLGHKRGITAEDTLSHIRAVVGETKFGSWLDVGAGEGSLLALLDGSGIADRLAAVEISGSGLDAIRARALDRLDALEHFDGYRIPFADDSFDVASAIHVVEHVEHERLFLKELSRVARTLVVEVPLENGLRFERARAMSGPYGHINFYTAGPFLNLLMTSGWVPERSLVSTSSLRLDRHAHGRVKGTVKHAVREAALRVAPSLAPWWFTYMLTVRCRRAGAEGGAADE